MLTIRAEQVEAFQSVADALFAEQIMTYLRANHVDAVVTLPAGSCSLGQLPDDTFKRMVIGGIHRAREYGLTWESTLGAFVVLMFMEAPNFDRHPLIQRVLKDKTVEPDARIDLLWERISEQSWQIVEQEYDPLAWQVT